jgi:folate-dependent phosphoribosylglycinamide formyltransferase PurN
MSDKILKDTVIFTNGNLFSKIILDRFLKKYSSRISTIIIVTGDYYGSKGIRALFNYLKYTSWIYVFYKIWTLLIIRLLKIGNEDVISSVSQLCYQVGIPYLYVADINDPALFENIIKRDPKYLISVSCPQLIRQKWLQLVKGKGINIHGSVLPKYAGIAPYFWVLAHGEKETGITVHYLIKGFDKGNILSQRHVEIQQGISGFYLFLQLCSEGQNILPEAFEKIVKDDPGERQDRTSFTFFSHPTTSGYLKLKQNGFSLFNFSDFKKLKDYL